MKTTTLLLILFFAFQGFAQEEITKVVPTEEISVLVKIKDVKLKEKYVISEVVKWEQIFQGWEKYEETELKGRITNTIADTVFVSTDTMKIYIGGMRVKSDSLNSWTEVNYRLIVKEPVNIRTKKL